MHLSFKLFKFVDNDYYSFLIIHLPFIRSFGMIQLFFVCFTNSSNDVVFVVFLLLTTDIKRVIDLESVDEKVVKSISLSPRLRKTTHKISKS